MGGGFTTPFLSLLAHVRIIKDIISSWKPSQNVYATNEPNITMQTLIAETHILVISVSSVCLA